MKALTILSLTLCALTLSAEEDGSWPKYPEYFRDYNSGFSLDQDIKNLILRGPNIEKIASISRLEVFYRGAPNQIGHTILVIGCELELKEGFESIWHGEVVIIKKNSDADWKKAKRLRLGGKIGPTELQFMSDEDFEALVEQTVVKGEPCGLNSVRASLRELTLGKER
jgi:hypothetical protein